MALVWVGGGGVVEEGSLQCTLQSSGVLCSDGVS